MDIIFLKTFRIKTLIGIYPWEKKIPQTIELNLEIGLPSKQGHLMDRIEDTLDYAKIVERIRAMLTGQHFSLLETLTENIAQMILTEFQSPWVKVSAAKLDVLEGVQKLGIAIERGKRE
ncbi:MAG: dihydroneopterin aldolase [Nitrosomonas sp.]|jgi:dihydroneopterin aldolase|nr:dihydroneopterin aldolase [Nitrosomonas sp.]MCC7135054.1 dihydroneopterin aldolase [Nitrosomonas sp.]